LHRDPLDGQGWGQGRCTILKVCDVAYPKRLPPASLMVLRSYEVAHAPDGGSVLRHGVMGRWDLVGLFLQTVGHRLAAPVDPLLESTPIDERRVVVVAEVLHRMGLGEESAPGIDPLVLSVPCDRSRELKWAVDEVQAISTTIPGDLSWISLVGDALQQRSGFHLWVCY
jgi:hypothetical protein